MCSFSMQLPHTCAHQPQPPSPPSLCSRHHWGQFALRLAAAWVYVCPQVELVLHGRYSHVQEAPPGSNAAVRNALKELEGYEMAVGGGFVRRSQKGALLMPLLQCARVLLGVEDCCFGALRLGVHGVDWVGCEEATGWLQWQCACQTLDSCARVYLRCAAASCRCLADSSDPPPVNHEALTYAHAAAAVRACAFPLNAKMSPALLQQVGTLVPNSAGRPQFSWQPHTEVSLLLLLPPHHNARQAPCQRQGHTD